MLLRAQAVAGLPEQFALVTSSRQIQLAPWVDEVVKLADTDDNDFRDVRRLSVDASFRELRWTPPAGRRDSNVLATTVAQFVESDEPVEKVASWYHLTAEQVDEAIRYNRVHPPAV